MTEHTLNRLQRIENLLLSSTQYDDMVNEFSLLVNSGFGGVGNDVIEYLADSSIASHMTEIAICWLQTCAEETYRIDDRNRDSHRVALQLLKNINEEEYIAGKGAKEICQGMARDHRTLQQNFTRMMIKWLYDQCIIHEKPDLPYV